MMLFTCSKCQQDVSVSSDGATVEFPSAKCPNCKQETTWTRIREAVKMTTPTPHEGEPPEKEKK